MEKTEVYEMDTPEKTAENAEGCCNCERPGEFLSCMAGKADLEIREMYPEDVDEVAALEREIFTMPWSGNGFLSSLAQKDTLYLAVRLEGKLVGYCGLLQSFDEADITNVAVHPGHRAGGIGYRMLCELMERGKQRGIRRFTLEVRAGNRPAIRLYEKLGFAAAGIRKNFYERPKEDALIMWTEDSH